MTAVPEMVQSPNINAPRARRNRMKWKLLLISLAVFAADRLSKEWIIAHIRSGYDIPIIPGFFKLTHVYNNGAAFSLFADTPTPDTVRWTLVGFSVVAILIVLAILWRAGRSVNLTSVGLALILGGAAGNLYDRVILRYVTDFLSFNIFGYHYPDFNVADSSIVIGACLLLIQVFRAPGSIFTE